jgi:hypothetical protein
MEQLTSFFQLGQVFAGYTDAPRQLLSFEHPSMPAAVQKPLSGTVAPILLVLVPFLVGTRLEPTQKVEMVAPVAIATSNYRSILEHIYRHR